MPNKYYLREDRMAVTKEQYDRVKSERPNPGLYEDLLKYYDDFREWDQKLFDLPALDVDPDYLKRLSPGWFEGEERREILTKGGWAEIGGDWYNRAKESHRRLTIVAPQEAEKGQEGGTVKTLSKVLTELWEEARERHTPVGKYYDVWTNSETDCIQRAMDAILIPATPQPITGEGAKPWEAAIDYCNANGITGENELRQNFKSFLAGHSYAAASRPSDAVEFSEWMCQNGIRVYKGKRFYNASEIHQLFLQSKSPNPNK